MRSLLLALAFLLISFPVWGQSTLTTIPGGDTFAFEQKLNVSDIESGDRLGSAVALDGDRALVAAILEDNATGAVYLFERVRGVWTLVTRLVASDRVQGDQFGSSVALDGNRALIGARRNAERGNNAGAAYIFEPVGGVWQQTAKITSLDVGPDDNFGVAVSLEGGRALIGASGDDTSGDDAGTAYVFELAMGGWQQTQRLFSIETSPARDLFGRAVSLSGDLALIGASGARGFTGSAYIFDLVAGTWEQVAELEASDDTDLDVFGEAVSLEGDRALVGARLEDEVASSAGAAYVYERTETGWAETQKLTAFDGMQSDQFGQSVSLSGERLVVGTMQQPRPGDPPGGVPGRTGAAYVYELVDGVWELLERLVPSDGEPLDFFGIAVAASGDGILVGALLADTGADDTGGAYFYGPLPPYLLTGAEGWRLLALPAINLLLGGRDGGFLGDLYTAGFVGADADQRNRRGLANVFLYDEPTDTYPVPKRNDSVVPGQGFWVYVYEDDEPFGEPGVQGGFPKALDPTGGSPVAGSVAFDLSFTPGAPREGFNLLGNPYLEAIDWDDPSWTKTDVSETVYVWDPEYNEGDHRTWNGTVGDLEGGIIPSGQGFHVEALGGGAALTVAEDAQTGRSGAVYGKRAVSGLHFQLSGSIGEARRQSEAFVMLSDDVSLGLDARDGRRLAGGSGDALRLYTLAPKGEVLAIAALPFDVEGQVELPLHAEALASGEAADARATLAWEAAALPTGWTATLNDRQTGQAHDLTEAGQVALRLGAQDALTVTAGDRAESAKTRDPLAPPPVPQARPLRVAAHKTQSTRFTLVLTPEASGSQDAATFSVSEAIPNPTRGMARLGVTLAEAGTVSVYVYDALGREVVSSGMERSAGAQDLSLPVAGLAPGAYVVRVEAPGGTATRRLTVVR
ncbi:MAG: T9SS type A sorting domain-containing protein [Bacteroidota bacterium]